MGFWHTGYMEFHDPAGLDPPFVPLPIVFACPLCSATFQAEGDLRQHHFETHPLAIPRLLVRGMTLGRTEFVSSEALAACDVATTNASEASINGRPVAVGQLGLELSCFANATVYVELGHNGIRENFRLRFDVAKLVDIEGVERAFRAMAKACTLDVRAVDEFIRNVAGFSTAQRYADGICDYLYGVLAKEGSGGSTIGYDAHTQKFNSANHTLAGYKRPLASVIRSLVALSFNQFREATDLGTGSRIGVVANRFRNWLSGSDGSAGSDTAIIHQIDSYLTDRDSELVVRAVLHAEEHVPEAVRRLEDELQRGMSERDRAKLRVLLAQVYASLGRPEDSLRHVRELQNIDVFRGWANRMKEKVRKDG